MYLFLTTIRYHRTNVLCCKERSPQKKKYSNSKVREENIAVVFIQLWSLQLEKFILVASYFSLSLGGDGCGWELAVWHTPVIADWAGRIGASEPLTRLFWKLPSTLSKSRYLFSYIEILENKSKILECSISLVKHVIIHLW